MNTPVLYSFRRCPYAMRARLAIAASGIQVELREIVLKDKPQAMLTASPKGTVPVLITTDGQVIDESLDVMQWALEQSDPQNWLTSDPTEQALTSKLIKQNDGEFKYYLDRYKYADRYPEHKPIYYRQQAELTLSELEKRLAETQFLVSDQLSFADIAILPFIRQFALADKEWFDGAFYPRLQAWLEQFLTSALFNSIMAKLPPWQQGGEVVYFPA
jgi:glutathione S-transferase